MVMFALLAWLLLFFMGEATAEIFGALSGIIKDRTQAVVAGARTVGTQSTNVDTQVETLYTRGVFDVAAPWDYDLTVEAPGFK